MSHNLLGGSYNTHENIQLPQNIVDSVKLHVLLWFHYCIDQLESILNYSSYTCNYEQSNYEQTLIKGQTMSGQL